MGHVDLGPELADRPGDEVGVAVEIVQRLDRSERLRRLAREVREVEADPLRDRRERRPDARGVGRGEPVEGGEALGQPLEQPALGRIVLDLREGGQTGDAPPRGEGLSERLELAEAVLPVDEPRVGDGVGGAGEEVGEADRRPHALGENGQGQGERPAHLPQQVEGHQS